MHNVTVTRSQYQGITGRTDGTYTVNVEGRGAVLCGLTRDQAQRAGHRLGRSPHIMVELEAIRAELARDARASH